MVPDGEDPVEVKSASLITIVRALSLVQRRRERGRRSQAAFRKRQAQASRDLTDENRRLKEAIQSVVNASRGGERTELLDSIHDLADAAGIETDRPVPCIDSKKYGGVDTDSTDRDFVSGSKQYSLSLAAGPAAAQRLTCGIWLDPVNYMRISLPPQDIIPYLGGGSKTFAGCIFWSIMDHAYTKCRHTHAGPTDEIQRSLAHSKALRDIKPSFIRAMVESRLEYKKTGSISSKYAAAAEPDLSAVVHGQVEQDYRASGKDSAQWLSCVAIESRVRYALGDAIFSLLERAVSGDGDPALRDFMDSIKCRLYDTFICFGDGPRWNVNIVDEMFLGWTRNAGSLTRHSQ